LAIFYRQKAAAESCVSTAAMPTRREALALLNVHLREGHSSRLATPIPETVAHDWDAILA